MVVFYSLSLVGFSPICKLELLRSKIMSSKSRAVFCYQDRRESDTWVTTHEIDYSQRTADKVQAIINAQFPSGNTYDQRLVQSVFVTDSTLNWFEFNNKENPDTRWGISISGDKFPICYSQPTFAALNQDGRRVDVTVNSDVGTIAYELSFADLCGDKKDDLGVVALYNSQSFTSYTQCSTDLRFHRQFRIIDSHTSIPL
jgi:hypothetical protein